MTFAEEYERVAAMGGFEPPVFPVGPHPFSLVEGNRYCGVCGGGIMHHAHEVQEVPAK